LPFNNSSQLFNYHICCKFDCRLISIEFLSLCRVCFFVCISFSLFLVFSLSIFVWFVLFLSFSSSSQLLFQPFSRYELYACLFGFLFCQNKKQTVNCKNLYFWLVSVVSPCFFPSSQLLFELFFWYEYCLLVIWFSFFCQNKKQNEL